MEGPRRKSGGSPRALFDFVAFKRRLAFLHTKSVGAESDTCRQADHPSQDACKHARQPSRSAVAGPNGENVSWQGPAQLAKNHLSNSRQAWCRVVGHGRASDDRQYSTIRAPFRKLHSKTSRPATIARKSSWCQKLILRRSCRSHRLDIWLPARQAPTDLHDCSQDWRFLESVVI